MVDFFGPFSLEKIGGKNPHKKIHGKIQIRIWEFRGQNPHCKDLPLKVWPVIWGGAERRGGGKRTEERALPKLFWDPSKRAFGLLCRGFLYRKNRALTPGGGGPKRTVRGGSKTPFWEGCHLGEKKTDKGKSHKRIWRSDATEASQRQTRDVPGTPGTFGPDLCVNQY